MARVAGCAAVVALPFATGCERGKSFMDPSVTGGWNPTPTIMPILDRIASIEDSSGEFVEYSDPLAEDLIPQPESYRIGPGDTLRVVIFDIIVVGQQEEYDVPVDARGMIEIPQLGRIGVAGRTTEEAQDEIVAVIQAKNLVTDPLVQVLAISQRQQTFTIIGAVQSPGLYPLPRADYRLLEALSAAGNFEEQTSEIYVIRQVPLSEEVLGIPKPATPGLEQPGEDQVESPDTPKQPAQDLLDVIDQIAPAQPKQEEPKPPAQAEPQAPPKAAPGMLGASRRNRALQQQGEAPKPQPAQPQVDLIDSALPPPTQPPGDGAAWVFVNGKWVKVKTAPAAQPAGAEGKTADQLLTQRVIRVRLRELLSGKQSLNIVIRAGDVIRFPAENNGLVYIGGQIARPGPYQLAPRLTLQRAITGAGGLGELAVPDRVDLTRMIGDDRQATIRLDYSAIARQAQPDVVLKPNDMINIGTSFWALPLAVTRNGFRVTYGFGFILDRNLSNDIFGPPPVNQVGQ